MHRPLLPPPHRRPPQQAVWLQSCRPPPMQDRLDDARRQQRQPQRGKHRFGLIFSAAAISALAGLICRLPGLNP